VTPAQAAALSKLPEAGAFHAARAAVYGGLSRAFLFPDQPLHREVASGSWLDGIRSNCEALPYPLTSFLRRRWRAAAGYDEFQSSFISLFQIGRRGAAPCPLSAGDYARDRQRNLEQVIRFYSYFQVRMAAGRMPDEASTELEFMYYLSSLTARAPGTTSGAYLFAQRDFLRHHLLSWWPALATRVRAYAAPGFYRSLVIFTGRFMERDIHHLEWLLHDPGGEHA
jgi:DMSO reductase family type II enzyme chaperone